MPFKLYYTIIFSITCFFIVSEMQAQYNVKSIISADRPVIYDTAAFVRDIRAKAEKIVVKRMGKAYFRMVDSTYFYPWYYKNVYFNTAPSEKNYRVAFWLNRKSETHINFELRFDKSNLELIDTISSVLPDCRRHPSECVFISSAQACSIASGSFKNYFKGDCHSSFRYDPVHKTMVWICTMSHFTSAVRGDTGYAVIDANSGKVLSSTINKDVWMGR